jgi:hypothetical protein
MYTSHLTMYLLSIRQLPIFKVEPKSLVTYDRSFALEIVFTGTQIRETFLVYPLQGSVSPSGDIALENLNGKVKGRGITGTQQAWQSS